MTRAFSVTASHRSPRRGPGTAWNGGALRLSEVFGLAPLKTRLAEARLVFRGDGMTPPTRYDRTSLRQLLRWPGPRIWAGARVAGRRVPISNLFSHVQPPPEEGWSVRITSARDFMGTQLTYDSHNGTDFATPVGTRVLAAAEGVVRRISSEFNRGGLKVFIDHGRNLVTTSNHLARALVRVGDHVRRGQIIALSGYSGLDGLATFPFGIPHVHFNVWLDGEAVDPFARDGEASLWRTGNAPAPFRGGDTNEDGFEPSAYDDAPIEEAIAACVSESSRAEILACADGEERAMTLLFHMNYYPTRFRARPRLYARPELRSPRLDLPFSSEDYDGIVLPDPARPWAPWLGCEPSR